jgi:hypothetical protein
VPDPVVETNVPQLAVPPISGNLQLIREQLLARQDHLGISASPNL